MKILNETTAFDIKLGMELSQTMKPNPNSYILCFSQLQKIYDDDWGGFGMAPKFPQPSILDFLLYIFNKKPDISKGKQCLEMVLTTLKKMAMGGIHDHIGQVSTFYNQ